MVEKTLTSEEERLYTRIYSDYRDSIFRYIFARTRNEDIAVEVTSNVFIKLFKNFHTINQVTVRAWLYAVARNALVDYWRKQKNNAISVDDEFWELNTDGVHDDSVEETVKNELQKEVLKKVISKFSGKDREILTLRIYDELQFDEIAEVVKLSEGSVKMKYYRAVEKIAPIVDKRTVKLVSLLI